MKNLMLTALDPVTPLRPQQQGILGESVSDVASCQVGASTCLSLGAVVQDEGAPVTSWSPPLAQQALPVGCWVLQNGWPSPHLAFTALHLFLTQ